MAEDDTPAASTPSPSLGALLAEGARSALLLPVRWTRVRATPARVAGLTVLSIALAVVLERLLVEGPAVFWWQTLAGDWWWTAALVWLCWAVTAGREPGSEPGTASLYTLLLAQSLPVVAVAGSVQVALARFDAHGSGQTATAAGFAVVAWLCLAQVVVLWRAVQGRRPALALVLPAIALLAATLVLAPRSYFWYPDRSQEVAEEQGPPPPTQEVVEAQPALLEQQLAALAPQRPGVVDLYAITYAPYADEDVFMRESAMVASVVEQRYDAAGRVQQLVNNGASSERLPWATPLNLRRAIERAAARMDRDEDLLFVHLTSHGAGDGRLVPGDWPPLALPPVTPAELRGWLDEAGVRWRVLSVSACYSGSWIAPLAEPGTLVVTASDTDHTSYGCGRASELTYFGRAMYDEQLRSQTRSFEKAHAAARPLIEQREREAGKSDGYSNPQIAVGDAIRERLLRLEARLDPAVSR